MRARGTTLFAACRLSFRFIKISPGFRPVANRSGTSPDGKQGRNGSRGSDLPRPRASMAAPVRTYRSGNPASAASSVRIIRSSAGARCVRSDAAGPILQQGLQRIGRVAA